MADVKSRVAMRARDVRCGGGGGWKRRVIADLDTDRDWWENLTRLLWFMNSHLDLDSECINGEQRSEYDGAVVRKLLVARLGAAAGTNFIQLWVMSVFADRRQREILYRNRPLGALSCDYAITLADLGAIAKENAFRDLRRAATVRPRSTLVVNASMDTTSAVLDVRHGPEFIRACESIRHLGGSGGVTWIELWKALADTSASMYLFGLALGEGGTTLDVMFKKIPSK